MKLIMGTSSDGVISAKFVNGGSDEISGYRICFSLLSKCSVVSGCKIIRQFGGYAEMALENHGSLKINKEWNFSFKYVHIKDAKKSIAPGQWGKEVPWGEGDFNNEEFLNTLNSIDYKGALIIEREAGTHRSADIKHAAKLLSHFIA